MVPGASDRRAQHSLNCLTYIRMVRATPTPRCSLTVIVRLCWRGAALMSLKIRDASGMGRIALRTST